MKLLKELEELLKEPEPLKVEIGGETYHVNGRTLTNAKNPLDVWTVGELDREILADYAVPEPEGEQEIDHEPER